MNIGHIYIRKGYQIIQFSLLSRIPISSQFGDNFWSPINMTAGTLLFMLPTHVPNHIDQSFGLQLQPISCHHCEAGLDLCHSGRYSIILKYQAQLPNHFYTAALYYIPTL